MFKITSNIIEFDGWRVGALWTTEDVPATIQADVRDALERIEYDNNSGCREKGHYATIESLNDELKAMKAERDAYAVMLGIPK